MLFEEAGSKTTLKRGYDEEPAKPTFQGGHHGWWELTDEDPIAQAAGFFLLNAIMGSDPVA